MRAPVPFAATALALLFASGLALGQAGVPAAPPTRSDASLVPYNVAALLGFGFSQRPDSQGIGLGLRGGVTLPSGLYVGGNAVYHLGGRAETLERTDGSRDVISAKSFYLGGEAGAPLLVGPFTMRPYVGLGFHAVMTTVKSVNDTGPFQKSSTDLGFYVAPGFAALYPLFDNLFAGIDARYVITPLDLDARGVSLFATAGKGF